MYPRRTIAVIMAAGLALGQISTAQESEQEMPHQHLQPDVAAMIDLLKEGGHVLVIRHERTNAWLPDDADFDIANCATQRNLSVAGAANATENGGVIRYLGIPIGDVFASPMCRTLETGRLMFRNVEAAPALLGYMQEQDEVRDGFTDLILAGAGQAENTALVTHLGTFSFMFGGHLAEGDAAVFSVENGEPHQLGVIPANAWNDAVIDATIRDRAKSEQHSGHEHDHN